MNVKALIGSTDGGILRMDGILRMVVLFHVFWGCWQINRTTTAKAPPPPLTDKDVDQLMDLMVRV
jgi:hypothetical protein